jgi:TetR/AcrR family acrAB operon transcriptional repressor
MRRTKEQAEKTRRRIIASALRVFSRRGFARTTIGDIAKDAGVTRGAVYWHFIGKQALLQAIRDSVSLPFLDRIDLTLLHDCDDDPLDSVERFLTGVVRTIDRDREVRLALEVMSFKCEYVGTLAEEREALVRNTDRLRVAFDKAYSRARSRGSLRADLSPQDAALETVAFLSGLVRLLLLDANATGMRKRAPFVVRAHMQSRRATHAPVNGARRSARTTAAASV